MATIKNELIGLRFKELRSSILTLTQNQLSEKLSVTQANISQIEHGECLPTANFIKKIAEKFPDTNFNWLIYGSGSPKRSQDVLIKIKEVKLETERNAERKNKKIFSDLNSEMERLKDNNTNLIRILSKKVK